MNREEYRASLSRLPIKEPKLEDMVLVCPHLDMRQAFLGFNIGTGHVACPPLRVRRAFQVVSYRGERVEAGTVWRGNKKVITGRKNYPSVLEYAFAGRTKSSYAGWQTHQDIFANFPGMVKAMKYAENNWGNELILDDWVDMLKVFIQDPADIVNDRLHFGSPRTKTMLYVALNRSRYDIMKDCSKPKSELFDDAIAQMTLDPLIYQELKGGRGYHSHFNCARCGYGLSVDRCRICGYSFSDNGAGMELEIPLSRKMVDFLILNGHKFTFDPEIAWDRERVIQKYKK